MSLLRGGFLTGISNPKSLLFAAAFLPQFVEPRTLRKPQLAALVVVDVVVEAIWCCVYGVDGRSIPIFSPAVRGSDF